MAPVRCPLCGATNATCGQRTSHTPIDTPRRQEATMAGDLHDYPTVINGIETVLRLNDRDAQARGFEPAGGNPTPAKHPEKKPAAKKRTPANKARAAADKTGS